MTNKFMEALEQRREGTNLFQQELQRRVVREPEVTRGQAFMRSATENLVGGAARVPRAVGGVAESLLPGNIIRRATGLGEPTQFAQQIPAPTGSQIFGAGQRAGELASAVINRDFGGQLTPFDEAVQQQEQTSQQFKEQQPGASFAGDVVGGGALLLGLSPFARMVARGTVPGQIRVPEIPRLPGLTRDLNKVFEAKFSSELGRGLGRTLETGIQGGLLAAATDGDPKIVAGIAAGTQAAGSIASFLASKPLRRLAPTVITTIFAVEVAKQVFPGLEQNIFKTKDMAVTKVAAAFGTAAIAQMAGLGRKAPFTRKEMEFFGDSIMSAVPRAATVSLINELVRTFQEGDLTLEATLDQFSRDPNSFTRKQRETIEKAINDPDKSVMDAIDKLLEDDPKFREMLELRQRPTSPSGRGAPP